MSKAIDDLLAAEAKAVEEAELTGDPDAPLPAHVKVTPGVTRERGTSRSASVTTNSMS
jgi:hypothetical protein